MGPPFIADPSFSRSICDRVVKSPSSVRPGSLGCLEGIDLRLGDNGISLLHVRGIIADAYVPFRRRVGAGHTVEIILDLPGIPTALAGLHNGLAMASIVGTALPGHKNTVDFLLENSADHLSFLHEKVSMPTHWTSLIDLRPTAWTR